MYLVLWFLRLLQIDNEIISPDPDFSVCFFKQIRISGSNYVSITDPMVQNVMVSRDHAVYEALETSVRLKKTCMYVKRDIDRETEIISYQVHLYYGIRKKRRYNKPDPGTGKFVFIIYLIFCNFYLDPWFYLDRTRDIKNSYTMKTSMQAIQAWRSSVLVWYDSTSSFFSLNNFIKALLCISFSSLSFPSLFLRTSLL